jgi:peptidoglycan L-alanyl-D-glutamate endopeptidase CwlK
MTYRLSQSSLSKLEGVHPDLVKVIKRAIEITPIDFRVIEGKRTLERQKQLVARGASKTMNSRHLVAKNGYAHAVDIVPLEEDGDPSWAWPDYYPLAKAVKKAAEEVGVKIEWGGDWKTFKDGPHWQLPFKEYPK